jgi:cell division protein FtsI/penicillin-binding protein 2
MAFCGRIGRLALALPCFVAAAGTMPGQRPTNVAGALSHALQGTSATALVLDQATGRVLAEVEAPVNQEAPSLPGSAIKPLLLAYALEHGIVREDMEVYCRPSLRVAGRGLPCTHPAERPAFTAERALAESCNTWFAELGRRFTGEQLEAALDHWRLPHFPMADAGVDHRELTALGLRGVQVSPLDLARAYRELVRETPPDSAVVRGLRGSVSYGMAHPAAVAGMTILGKTGTARDTGAAWTHGWFAGALPGRLVLVVYMPRGDGGTAAALARRFFVAVDGGAGGNR